MLKRDEALQLLLRTQSYLANIRLEYPEKTELRDAKILLDDLETEFYQGWPIKDTEKARSLGFYAGRILYDGPYKELPQMMAELAAQMGGYI